jgi:hypothetical protein
MAYRLWRLVRTTGFLLFGGILAPAELAGQELIVPLQFSFSDPGARSMGFGGAFVALADDATAAFANPAGLVQLARPEVSIEARRWSYSTPYTRSGRAEGLPSGTGIDNTVGLRNGRSEEVVNGLSFLALVYPKERWSVAFFRHELASFEFSGATQGLFGGGSDRDQNRLWDQRFATDLDFETFGVSWAYRVNDRLDLGFGVTYHQNSLVSRVEVFKWDDDTVESFFAPNSYLPERSHSTETLDGKKSDWSLTGGFRWQLSDSWSIGGVYRQSTELGMSVVLTAGPAYDPEVPPGEELFRLADATAEMPWILGLGFAYRAPDGGLTVSFQWDRIQYSSIIESLGLGDEQALADADELHLGGEYVFLQSTPIVAVRIGAWLDPEHQIRATGDDPYQRALQPRGKDEVHFTAGVGVAFENYQIDLGIDLADHLDTLSISAIYSF